MRIVLLGVVAVAVFAQPVPYKAGDRVDVDVIMAGAPERSMWRPGTVKAVDMEKREVIVATDPATDAGGREMGVMFQSVGKWLRRSASAAAPAVVPGAAPAKAPGAVAAAPAAPEGILDCPIEQRKVAPGSRPDGQVLAKVIRCLFEVKGRSAAERSVKVDIQRLEIGSSRDCVPREDFGCSIPVYKIYPALVRWTKTDYYTHSIQWSDNESVFNCFVGAFGTWECGLGKRIRDGQLQTRQR